MIRIKIKKTALWRRDEPLTDNPCKCTLSVVDHLRYSMWFIWFVDWFECHSFIKSFCNCWNHLVWSRRLGQLVGWGCSWVTNEKFPTSFGFKIKLRPNYKSPGILSPLEADFSPDQHTNCIITTKHKSIYIATLLLKRVMPGSGFVFQHLLYLRLVACDQQATKLYEPCVGQQSKQSEQWQGD